MLYLNENYVNFENLYIIYICMQFFNIFICPKYHLILLLYNYKEINI